MNTGHVLLICGAIVVLGFLRGTVADACGFDSDYENHLFNIFLCGLGIR